MLKRLVNEALIPLTITTTGPVLVRSGHATLSGPDMTPVLTYRNGDWQVYLPGSSLKGVVRSHLEKVGRTLNEDAICNPFHKLPAPDAFCGERLLRRKKSTEEAVDSEVAYRESCPICRLFGSTEFIGRVSINDAYLVDSQRPRPTEERDGVGIDRLTGGAFGGALFNLEAVSSGVKFHTNIYLRNFEVWQLGMLLLLIQDMQDGLIRVGSGRSRGLGSVEGKTDGVTIGHIGLSTSRSADEVWGLGKFLSGGEYGTHEDDLLRLEQSPNEERRGLRMRATFTEMSLQELTDKAIGAFVTRVQGWKPLAATSSGETREERTHG